MHLLERLDAVAARWRAVFEFRARPLPPQAIAFLQEMGRMAADHDCAEAKRARD